VVDEVEIKNVGRNGVASEATLLELKKTFEAMAKAQGINTQKINEKLDGVAKKSSKAGEELGVLGKAASSAADSLKEMPKKAFDALGDSLRGLAGELASGTTRMSDFAGHMPGFGRELSAVTGLLDNSFETFQNLASSGATFGYSLAELRSQVARSGLTFSEYGSVISSSSQDLAAFGGTVAQGARQTNRLLGALGGQRERLLSLGATQEELNESLIFYQTLNRTGALTERRSARAQAEAAGDLTKNMLALSKLTGEDLKTQQDRIAQAQMDTAFQRERLRLSDQGQKKLDRLVQEAALVGPEAVNAVKAQFLGMPPLTQDAQIFASTQQEVYQELSRSMNTVRDDRVTFTQFSANTTDRMVRLAEDIATVQNRLDPLLRVGALDPSGIAGTMAEQTEPGMALIGSALENVGGQIRLDTEAMSERIRNAYDFETDDEVDTMARFQTALVDTRIKLMDNLVNPLVENNLEPILDKLTTQFDRLASSEGLDNLLDTIVGNPMKSAAAYLGISNLDTILGGAGALGLGVAGKKGIDRIRGKNSAGATSGTTTAAAGTSTILDKNGKPINLDDDDRNNRSKRSGRFTGALKGIGRKLPYIGTALTALLAVGDTALTLSDKDATAQEKATDVGGTAGGIGGMVAGGKVGAGLGAAIGTALLPGVGTAIGGVLGGGVGGLGGYLAGSDLGQFVGHHLFGGDKEQDNADQAQNLQAESQVPRVSDAHLASLERLVGFTPQVNTLGESVASLEQDFNSIQLEYREIDRATRSFEKMAEQLEEINKQLDGDQSFLDRLNPFNNSSNNSTAPNANISLDSKIDQLNTTMDSILTVLMESNGMTKKQLNATRSGNLMYGAPS